MTKIITKNSSTASAVPASGDLVQGELAVNVTDKKIFTKDSSGTVVKVVGQLGNQEPSAVAITGGTVAGVAQTGGTINNTPIGATTANAITGTLITATTGFSGPLTGAVTGNTTGTHTGAVVGNVTGNLTGNVTASSGSSTFNNVTINGTLDMDASSAATITNLPSPTNSGDAASKGYVDTQISNLVASAPSTLDTLNELAAALGNDASFATTVTTSIATKLPKAGGTMTGDIAMGTNKVTGLGAPTAGNDATTKTYVDTADALALPKAGGTMSGAIAMGTNKITGLGTPTAGTDATTKTYVDGILGSATAAATSAAAAATSETNAANSASSASTSATNAAASASAAAASATAASASAASIDPATLVKLTGNQTIAGVKTFSSDVVANGLTVGRGAGAVSTNTAVGASAIAATASGVRNTAVGSSSLNALTSGAENTSVGFYGLTTNTTGGYNTAVGSQALSNNSTGSNNTAVGQAALAFSSTASYNTAVGYQSGYSNTTGGDNTSVGSYSFYNNTTGYGNVAVGRYAMVSNTTGYFNTAVGGGQSGNSQAALFSNTTGAFNVGLGTQALYSNTTGNQNIAVGINALYSNTTATGNIAIGYEAGFSGTTAIQNVFVGWGAGRSTTGTANTFIGSGTNSGAGYYVTTGTKNTILGGFGGNQGGLDIRTASNYIVLSDGDGNPRGIFDGSGNFLAGTTSTSFGHKFSKNTSDSYAFTIENSTTNNPYGLLISYSGKSGLSTANELYLKCTDSTATRMYVSSNGGVANYSANNSNLSDRREKTDFAPAKSYLDVVCAIPVQTYKYIDQSDDELTLGVVAQDVQAVAPELVTESNWGTKEEPKMRLSIYQTDLQYALMKALQELKAEFDAYKATHP